MNFFSKSNLARHFHNLVKRFGYVIFIAPNVYESNISSNPVQKGFEGRFFSEFWPFVGKYYKGFAAKLIGSVQIMNVAVEIHSKSFFVFPNYLNKRFAVTVKVPLVRVISRCIFPFSNGCRHFGEIKNFPFISLLHFSSKWLRYFAFF